MKTELKKKIIMAVMAILLLFILTGCRSKSEITEIKINYKENNNVTLLVCWPEDSQNGKIMKRLVNNYNLSKNEGSKVNLSFSPTENDYFEMLKKMAATMTLPDVLLVLDSGKYDFLINSEKIQDLSQIESLSNDLALYRKKDNMVYGLSLSGGSTGFLIRKDVADYSSPSAINAILKCVEKYSVNVAANDNTVSNNLEEILSNGFGYELLNYLLSINMEDDKLQIVDILDLWKQIVLQACCQRENQLSDEVFYMFAWNSCEKNSGYISVSELFREKNRTTENKYAVSLSAKRGIKIEQKTVDFLKYLEENIRENNEFIMEDIGKTNIVFTEDQYLLVLGALRSYIYNLKKSTECAGELEFVLGEKS